METGCRLTGVDIDPVGVENAKQQALARVLNSRVEFVVADCSCRLPFGEEMFDAVTCIDAVCHLRDRVTAMKDWIRLLRPGGRLLFTDAAVLTGAVSKQELDIRASQGEFAFVPPQFNEKVIADTGFRLQKLENTTHVVAEIAARLHTARDVRSKALKAEEGVQWFDKRQRFLVTTATLAASGRLSRFRYVAEKRR